MTEQGRQPNFFHLWARRVPLRLAVLTILLVGAACACYVENQAKRQAEQVFKAFPLDSLREYSFTKPCSVAIARALAHTASPLGQGPAAALIALRDHGFFGDFVTLDSPQREIRLVLQKQFGLTPQASADRDFYVWRGIVNDYEVSFHFSTKDGFYGCGSIVLTPHPRWPFFTTVGVLMEDARQLVRLYISDAIKILLFLALPILWICLFVTWKGGAGGFRVLHNRWQIIRPSASGTSAVLATAGICGVGWLIWQILLLPFPADELEFDSVSEPFVGPYQIHASFVNVFSIVDTRAQRLGYLCMVGLLGLVILLRPVWLPFVNCLGGWLTRYLCYGILAFASVLAIWSASLWEIANTLAATFLILFFSHRWYWQALVRACCVVVGAAMVYAAIVPAFTTRLDLSTRHMEDFLCSQGHYYVVVGPGDRLAAGHVLFTEVEPHYGLLLPTLMAAYQRSMGSLLNWGDYVHMIQILQGISLLIYWWLYCAYSKGNWLYSVVALALIIPKHMYDQYGVFFPTHSGWRLIGVPLALAAMYATRRASPLQSALTTGAASALCILINFETGVIVSVGMISYHALRHRLLERWNFGLWATLTTGAVAAWTATLLLYLAFFRIFLGYWPDLARFVDLAGPSRRVVGSGLGCVALELEAGAVLIFAHACFVIVQACARPGLWRFRPAFRASVALIICLWFSYYINRPLEGHFWFYFGLYGFLLIDLLRNFDWHLVVRRRLEVLTLAGGLAWAAIIAPAWADNLQEALFARRLEPRGPLICGVYLPELAAAEIMSKAEFIKEKAHHQQQIEYLTPHSFLMPALSGVRPASGVGDLAWESQYYPGYVRSLRRVMANDVIYLDADALSSKNAWAFPDIYRRARDDLRGQFDYYGTVSGWEVWKRKRL